MSARKNPIHNQTLAKFSNLSTWIGLGAVILGLFAGVIAVAQPQLLVLCMGFILCLAVLVYAFSSIEKVVLGILILRTAIDFYPGVPALAGMGLFLLTLTYVVVQLLTGKVIQTDRFWWFFAGWVLFQGIWVILIPLGGLGFSESIYFSGAIREWVRLFSWLMIYLLFMQLKDKIIAEKAITLLIWSLAIPLFVSFIQLLIPDILPPLLKPAVGILEDSQRIKGTFVKSSAFTKYLLVFIGVVWWKVSLKRQQLRWMVLLSILVFVLILTRSVTTLFMLVVFVAFMSASRLNIRTILGGIVVLLMVSNFFLFTEYGQVRLEELLSTPLFNPDISFSRSILLQSTGGSTNSFHWRVTQWYGLLNEWQKSPWLGYGLDTTVHLSQYDNIAHNDYVRALVETGIVGLASFITFIVVQFIRLFKLIINLPKGSEQRRFCTVLLGLLIVSTLGMLTDNVWRSTVTYTYWWALFATAGWQWDKSPTEDSSTTRSIP
ncbi:O-antigen ligase family protein [Acaryochloris sp. IP29b_bin.137]|uniref:O-antigen ligase family protein n=1 Tax=Acaryochloris sp. IP29b_bin.137 TaxID=2969217 RepID=UPI0026282DAF|nr:O-antigen ligase family protein [Acaryochloris sp. IP29b_bin.137]